MTKFCTLASCYCLLPLRSRSHKHPHKHPLITPFELQMVGVSHENWGGGIITPLGGLDKSLMRQSHVSKNEAGQWDQHYSA